MAREHRADSDPVSDEGKAVQARRERLGLGKNELAEAADVSRDTVAAIEAGEGFRRSSLTKIENALKAAEDEAGLTAPPRVNEPAGPHIVVVQLKNERGEVVLQGPVEDLPALEAAAQRLLDHLGGGGSDS